MGIGKLPLQCLLWCSLFTCEHTYCSMILPTVFFWHTIQVFVWQGLSYWSQIFICLTLINPKKLCDPFNQEGCESSKEDVSCCLIPTLKCLFFDPSCCSTTFLFPSWSDWIKALIWSCVAPTMIQSSTYVRTLHHDQRICKGHYCFAQNHNLEVHCWVLWTNCTQPVSSHKDLCWVSTHSVCDSCSLEGQNQMYRNLKIGLRKCKHKINVFLW